MLNDPIIFWKSWKYRKIEYWVILPDHIHFIIKINDENLSNVIHNFKTAYSRLYRNKFGSGKVWQNMFWDHMIRNEKDMENHVNYIHYNPVKHQLVNNLFDWNESSVHKFSENGSNIIEISVDNIDFEIEYGE